jgi:hypothetical protein
MGNQYSTKCKVFKKFENGKIDIDEYNDQHCTICLQPIIKEGDCVDNCKICNTTEIWTCKHQFHRMCIKNWKKVNNSCPLCRCDEQIDCNELGSNNEDLEAGILENIEDNIYIRSDITENRIILSRNEKNYIMENVNDLLNNNLPLTLNKYYQDWDYELCDNQYDNHRVSFYKSYGVLATCSCGNTQAFNYLG